MILIFCCHCCCGLWTLSCSVVLFCLVRVIIWDQGKINVCVELFTQALSATRNMVKYYFLVCLWACSDSVDWVKRSTLTNVGGHYPICWGSKGNKKQRKSKLSSWAKTSIFSCSWTIEVPSSQTIGLWDLHQWAHGAKHVDTEARPYTLLS